MMLSFAGLCYRKYTTHSPESSKTTQHTLTHMHTLSGVYVLVLFIKMHAPLQSAADNDAICCCAERVCVSTHIRRAHV